MSLIVNLMLRIVNVDACYTVNRESGWTPGPVWRCHLSSTSTCDNRTGDNRGVTGGDAYDQSIETRVSVFITIRGLTTRGSGDLRVDVEEEEVEGHVGLLGCAGAAQAHGGARLAQHVRE
eukprot:7651469-Pyramimonas_sp.AAC.1